MIRLGKALRPRGRAGGIVLVAVLIGGGLAASIGAGYTVARPLLASGAETLPNGHSCAHVNGETRKADASCPDEFAVGEENLVITTLPDGKTAVVNTDTGQLTFVDSDTLERIGADLRRPKHRLEVLPARSSSYLVDYRRNVVEEIDKNGNPGRPVRVASRIRDAVPSGDSVWVVTEDGKAVEIARGRRLRELSLGADLRISVADNHPVVVDKSGTAYVVDGVQPTSIGKLDLPGDAWLGSWRGPGRYLIGVTSSGDRVAALDPRTGATLAVPVPVPPDKSARPTAPVQLGDWAYVPDESGPAVWRVNLVSKQADKIDVPGEPGTVDIKVSSEKVWVSNQYDQQAVLIDKAGNDLQIDKGPASGTEDSSRPPGSDPPQDEGQKPAEPADPPSGPPAPAGPPPAKQVVVPEFRAGTTYQEACAALEGLELVCESVAAGDADGKRSDEVIDTNPRAGSRLPVGTRVLVRYVGPVKVPNVVGLDHEAACETIKAAQLDCREEASSAPVAAPGDLLKVTSQDPSPNQDIDKGDPVTIDYPDSITLPSFAGNPVGAVCAQIEDAYRMTCDEQEGDPAVGPGATAGVVYDKGQQPPPGTAAKVGTSVTVFYYAGERNIPDYRRQAASAGDVCAAANADGFQCTPAEGVTSWQSGFQPFYVYEQNPAPGPRVPIGTPITLTYYSDKNTVPTVMNGDVGAAKAALEGAGFSVVENHQLAANHNVVNGQDHAGTLQPIRSPINIYYSPWRAVEYSIARGAPPASPWLLRQGPGTYPVGKAYPPGGPLADGQLDAVKEFTCVETARCGAGNKFYSSGLTSYPGFEMTNNQVAWVMRCPTTGAIPIYRVWRGQPPNREYGITSDPNDPSQQPPWEDKDLLGCFWP